MTREFNVIIERDSEGYYVASVPELRGCHTQAKSLDKLVERIKEAIALCLEVQELDQMPLECHNPGDGKNRSPQPQRRMAPRRGNLAPLPGPDHRLRKRGSVTPFTHQPALMNYRAAQCCSVTS